MVPWWDCNWLWISVFAPITCRRHVPTGGCKSVIKGTVLLMAFFDCFAVVGRGILFGTIWTVNKY